MAKNRELVKAIGLLIGVMIVLVFAYWSTFPHDFAALYVAAEFYEQGHPELVYQSDGNFFWNTVPKEWKFATEELATLYGQELLHYSPFVYPPIWAAILAPITSLINFLDLARLVLLVNVVLFAAMIIVTYRLLCPKLVSFNTWILLLVVLLGTNSIPHLALNLGQPQVFVSFLILLSFYCLAEGDPIKSGSLLALAASIKLAPVLFAAIFLMERNWRAFFSFIGVGCLLAALSVLMTGWPMHDAFLIKLSELDGGVFLSRINLGLALQLHQVSLALSDTFSMHIHMPGFVSIPEWINVVVKLMLIVGLLLTYFSTRHQDFRRRIWQRLVLVSLLILFTSPLGWIHYMIVPMMLIPGLLEYSHRRWVPAIVGILIIGYSMPIYLMLDQVVLAFLPQIWLHFGLAALYFVVVLILSFGEQPT